MADRTDLDALLIGAVYGELAPADEARLTAHLESHPADRTALDDLTHTRAAVRDSRILAFHHEPPHAVSAILLQEASRRARRSGNQRTEIGKTSGTEGWFQRLVTSFMAHPAMATAAMLVVVLGVTGLLYLRGVDQYAAVAPPGADRVGSVASKTESSQAESSQAVANGAAPVAPAPATALDDRAEGSAMTTGHAGSEAYRAGPGGGKAGAAAPRAGAPGNVDQAATQDGDLGAFEQAKTRARAGTGAASDAAKKAALAKPMLPAPDDEAAPVPRKLAKADGRAGKVRGIELRSPEPSPKELKDSADEKPAPRREVSANERAQAGAPRGAPPPAPPPPAATAAPVLEPTASAETQPVGKRPAPRPAPARGQASAGAADAKLAEERAPRDKAQDRALIEWARRQHDQVVSLVTSNRCSEAASAAVEIYNRAPDYFSANIVTDRQIKPCLAYVNNQRERADRSRSAAKNAADLPAPAQAAPSRK
jgi:hypothetical protein